MTIYNFPTQARGDGFKARKLVVEILNNNVTTPLDLTGCAILVQFRLTTNSEVFLEWNTADNSILITDAVNGEFQMQEKSLSVTPSVYMYDVQVTFPNGFVRTYFKGNFKIEADVSRNS